MSQNMTSERKFAFGTFETDSPQYETCQCPVSTANPNIDRTTLSNTHRGMIDMYDNIVDEYYADEYEYKGTISESEAIDVWQQLIDELYESGDKMNYMEAVNIAHKLGWIENLELYNTSDM